jgi:hypothetical protein
MTGVGRLPLAHRCIPLRFGASLSEDLHLDPLGPVGHLTPAPCVSGSSRSLRGYQLVSTSITLSFMDQNLCRQITPRTKFGRSRPTTVAAAPAAIRLVHLEVVRREQMAIAADIGYGHGLEDPS